MAFLVKRVVGIFKGHRDTNSLGDSFRGNEHRPGFMDWTWSQAERVSGVQHLSPNETLCVKDHRMGDVPVSPIAGVPSFQLVNFYAPMTKNLDQ